MKKAFTISETYVDHNNSFDLAKKLIDIEVDAKVNALKCQNYKSELCISNTKKKAKYKIKNTGDSLATQYEILKTLELSQRMHHELASLYMQHNL